MKERVFFEHNIPISDVWGSHTVITVVIVSMLNNPFHADVVIHSKTFLHFVGILQFQPSKKVISAKKECLLATRIH